MKHLKLCLMIIAMPYSLTACMIGSKTEFNQPILSVSKLILGGHKRLDGVSALWNPDNSILVSMTDDEIILRDGETGQPTQKSTMKNIHDLLFSPDGTRLMFKAFGSSTHPTVLYLCDGHTGRCINTIPIKFTTRIMFTDDSSAIILWNNNHQLESQQHLVFCYNAIDGTLKKDIIELTNNDLYTIQTFPKPIITLPITQQPRLLALSPDNRRLAAKIGGMLVLYELFSDDHPLAQITTIEYT